MRNNYAKFIAFAMFFVPFIAHATLTGLSGEVHAVNAIPGTITYRVYAEFSSPTDQLVAIYGYDTAPMSVSTTTSFYQETNSGGALSSDISEALFVFTPDLEYDSWFSIGRESSTNNNLQSIGFDWSAFEAGGNLIVNDLFGGTLFCLPGELQNYPVGGRVLVGQFTTDGVIDLQFNIQWRDVNQVSTDTENILLTLPAAGEGCTDPTATNYDPAATIDNGSCIFVNPSFTELTWELVASNAIPGFQTYRVYANFTNPNDQLIAVYGQDVTPLSIATSGSFYQNPLGTAYSTGITAGVLGLDPNAAYDSWVTIGAEDETGNNLQDLNIDAASFEAGNSLTINDPVGGAWFVFPDDQPSAFPDANGRVLVAQLTTDGIVDMTINFQYRAQNGTNPQEVGLNLIFPDFIEGCTDPNACNYDPAATNDDGSCVQPTVWYLDADGDGFGSNTTQLACSQPVGYVDNNIDCDDTNASVNPSAPEVPCNGIDDNCNGQIDETDVDGCTDPSACNYNAAANCDNGSCTYPTVWYLDADGDGFGSNTTELACSQPIGYVDNNIDCDDTNASVNPSAPEVPCNGIDDNCNGQIDENDVDGCTDPSACNFNAAANCDNGSCTYPTVWYLDADGDGFGSNTTQLACSQPVGYVDNNIDCDDTNASVNPSAPEVPCNGIDDNCNGQIDENDVDGCTDPSACNYNAAANCDNGSCTYPTVWYLDADGDGFGSNTTQLACSQPVGYVDNNIDCDDTNASVNPSAPEVPCNGIDDNCNGQIDETDVDGCTDPSACNYNAAANCDNGSCTYPTVWYLDADGDGFGSNTTQLACSQPVGYVDNNIDCDDTNASVNPGASEVPCNGLDDNCNGFIDETDVDGCTDPSACNFNAAANCDNGSCNYPTVWYLDADGDGFGSNTTQLACSQPVGYVDNNIDCDDTNASVNPGASEVPCNGLDDNCNGFIDETDVDGCTDPSACNFNAAANCDNGSCTYPTVWYLDADGDGFGSNTTQLACSQPVGYVDNNIDCDDTNASVNPGASEVPCNGLDDNCNGIVDENSVDGCIDPTACNFNAAANCDDGSCEYPIPGFDCDDVPGCTYPAAENYNPAATTDDGTCLFNCSFPGCTDPSAVNYDPAANEDDGSCIAAVLGCTDPFAVNYNLAANTDDGSCIATVFGCTDPAAFNYDPMANTDNGGCVAVQLGCTNPAFDNYNPYANTENGSCVNTCLGDLNTDGLVNTSDLLAFLGAFGTICN